jgi:two-component system cell cycle response regulator
MDSSSTSAGTRNPSAPASSRSQGAVALVVDDSPALVRVTVAVLELTGMFGEVLTAEDGFAAIAVMQSRPVDIVLCDMHMARCDGLRFLSLKAGDPALADIPVIMRTGDEGVDSMVQAFDLGAHDYLAKTAAMAELQARISVHLKLKRVNDELRAQRALLEQQSREDGLTGLANRRSLDEVLAREVSRCNRYGRPMSVIMIDLDRFKDLNDRYGHQAGDHVLCEAANVIRRSVRQQDVVARYGGEEIAILMPETSMEHAAIMAERLRVALASAVFRWRDHELRVTASLGVVGTPTMPTQAAEELMRLADRALYRAKAQGRNRVSLARADTGPTGPSGESPTGQN